MNDPVHPPRLSSSPLRGETYHANIPPQLKTGVAGIRKGFTLVEILVVIVIIGILAAIAIPAINAVRRTATTGLISVETQNLSSAVENYQSKYGEYPPDFSSWDLARRHYQRAFPEILDSEIRLLLRLCDQWNDATQTAADDSIFVPAVMDRGEALVWALGGFSPDPQRPFTGAGGPLALLPGATSAPGFAEDLPAFYQYNSERSDALFDFKPGDLSLVSASSNAPISFANRLQSNDELNLGNLLPTSIQQRVPDLFPVYRRAEDAAPFVYFDSRTYAFGTPNAVRQYDTGAPEFTGLIQLNGFMTGFDDQVSVVRPIKSDSVNSNIADPGVTPGFPASPGPAGFSQLALATFDFVNPQTFQILSPGIDGVYSAIGDQDFGDPSNAVPTYWMYPSGRVLVPRAGLLTRQACTTQLGIQRYGSTTLTAPSLGILDNYELDTVTSFSDGSFEGSLP